MYNCGKSPGYKKKIKISCDLPLAGEEIGWGAQLNMVCPFKRFPMNAEVIRRYGWY